MARSVLARHLGITGAPAVTRATVQKSCIPQYEVGHGDRMAGVHQMLRKEFGGRMRVAGSWYGGVGVNDCLRGAWEVVRGLRRDGGRSAWPKWRREREGLGTGLEGWCEGGRPMVRIWKGPGGVAEVVEADEGMGAEKRWEFLRGTSRGP